MKTVAIISEYNPFHSGHEYQIKRIREDLGMDTAVIAIMSGNYTQRGEAAIVNKHLRAKAAIYGGCNLILELPFPYSSSSAEYFARGAVSIISRLGICDYISFGSESGDIDALKKQAEVMTTDEFKDAYARISAADRSLGHPRICELAYRSLGGEVGVDFAPNNILAIEYIKAVGELAPDISLHTVRRSGSGYNADVVTDGEHPSALSVRELIRGGSCHDLPLPEYSKNILAEAHECGELPADISVISAAIISNLRLNPPCAETNIHDGGNGLYNRIQAASLHANDFNTLLKLTVTKGYTTARIRRVILNSLLGVTSSDVRTLPEYTQVLAMDQIGMLLLKNARKRTAISVLTKPSATEGLSERAIAQKTLSDAADRIYELMKPVPKSAAGVLTFTPFIKK
jgi:predicted nucleotidyltransferase